MTYFSIVSYKKIYEIIIDDKNKHLVSDYNWKIRYSKNIPYVVAHAYINGKRTTVSLHRLILGAQHGEIVDHINGDTLNNLESNLRKCTQQVNALNRHNKANNKSSRYIGVSFWKRDNKWKATFRGKHIGLFETERDAFVAYKKAKQSFIQKNQNAI